jgi:hypothetical protein
MARKAKKGKLTPAELDEQQATELPHREALSLVLGGIPLPGGLAAVTGAAAAHGATAPAQDAAGAAADAAEPQT